MSDHTGKFDCASALSNHSTLFLLCAGTGFTPMAKLTQAALTLSKRVHVVFFNKTEKDIQWREQLERLEREHEGRFHVVHVLSQDLNWGGIRGKVSKELLSTVLPDKREGGETLTCVCGPNAFTDATVG